MSGFLYTPKLHTTVFTTHRTQDCVLSHTGNHSSCEAGTGSQKPLGLGYKVRPCLKNKKTNPDSIFKRYQNAIMTPLAARSLGLGMQFNSRGLPGIQRS